MEEKKKDLLRRLTIISIPFVFVAIPSIVIIVGMLSPHAAEPRDAAAAAQSPAQNHSVSMLSTMTGGQMILSCRAAFAGNWEYFHYFILDPYKPQRAYFQPPTVGGESYAILCKWGYMGNFLQDVVVFNSSAAYARRCRVEEGGCHYLFQDGHMFLVTGKQPTKAAPEQRREKALVGDLVLRECTHVLAVFPTMCRYKRHDHQYVGNIIGRWRWWFNY
uniref:DUF7771 domain-containing protein n=1 Tax=Leersia perrieri TaxID=77586 RepID=A0A0D9XA19_9ORYZ